MSTCTELSLPMINLLYFSSNEVMVCKICTTNFSVPPHLTFLLLLLLLLLHSHHLLLRDLLQHSSVCDNICSGRKAESDLVVEVQEML